MSDISNKETGNALGQAKEMSKEQGRRLWEIIKRYSQADRLTASSKRSASVLKPPPKKRYSSVLLSILSLFPYLLLFTFGFSFYWDFNGITSSLFNYPLQFEGLLKIVSVSGLIGFLTNWVAITMLFKPAKRRPLLGHGLIPAQKDRIAFRLAQAVSEDLINPDIIKQKINESNIISKYRKSSTRYV